MALVTLGKKGEVAIPAEILERLGLAPGARLKIEAQDGAITLRPAWDDLVEIYTDERLKEFEEEDKLDPEIEARIRRLRTRV